MDEPSLEPPPALPPSKKSSGTSHPLHKTLASAANLANLLPTGTVLAFRALTPSFTNKGYCQLPNEYLTACLIGCCTITCFLSSFTDSFTDRDGKLYYGIATLNGLCIFNCGDHEGEEREDVEDLAKFRIRCMDFVHAFVSLFVFLIFALSDPDVQMCFFREAGGSDNALTINLPLAAGVLSSFLFVIFPTTRRGIGYADVQSLSK
ncbi:hypothetical protein RJ640_002212 [Escallonia rubra]|uniref:Uncharacterized protein n=1 Tax=Escallonia rubra TaxID=112253 RepID=A0AA88UB22_9ASTE|nr:hypothetical protein RJ640_002212 [Escallonia rubra]